MDKEEFKQVKTGNDLYKFINCLLEENFNLPELSDYLISLWKVSEEYANKTEFQYSDMAYMLQKAFLLESINIRWDEKIIQPYDKAQKTISNTLEYYEEIKTYEYFCRLIKNMIIDLLRMKQEMPPYMHWENIEVSSFLERASLNFKDLVEENTVCDWLKFKSLLNSGQYDE